MSPPTPHLPRLDVVLRTVSALQKPGRVTAPGGSGLFAAYGLIDTVRDWDLTTDAEAEAVAAARQAWLDAGER